MNNKGGCGKTTTAIAFGLHLVRSGKNVLFWDNDPQSNLSQRLGLPDEERQSERLSYLFRNADTSKPDEEQRKLSIIIKYPYTYRIKGAIENPGHIGLLAGDHNSEIEANSAQARLSKNQYLEPEDRDIYGFFRRSVNFYRNYYDYIIIDTAPALEGNILNKLAVRTADEIICPIDGLEAALGVRTLLTWMNGETRPETSGLTKQPNALFAMVKYVVDTKNLGANDALRVRNSVYRAMKETFDGYVCDNGVRELRAMRGQVAGFGRKTDYHELSDELIEKMYSQRANIFTQVNKKVFEEFSTKLAQIEAKTLPKRPGFKKPYFELSSEQTIDQSFEAA
jgi:cellulose biosynthesis protein BcsQ